MLDIVHPLAERYAARFSSPETDLLATVSAAAAANHAQPHMLSGHVQGGFLAMVSQMIKPKQILEVGTMVGYSSICLAAGLQPDGKLHTIELREADSDIAEQHFIKAGMHDKISLHRGDALQIIPTLHETWDLVFLDADKVNYVTYYEMIKPSIRQGGYLLADNVLFHGAVLHDEVRGKNAQAIHAFNQHVRDDDEVTCVILPFRDGLSLIRKN